MVLDNLKLEHRKTDDAQNLYILFIGDIEIGLFIKTGNQYQFQVRDKKTGDHINQIVNSIEEGLEWIKTKLYGN